jgi:hypothetical protein
MIALFSATHDNGYAEFTKQIIWFFVGIAIAGIFASINYNFLTRISPIIYGLFIILLVGVLFTKEINGATSWFDLGAFSFQPGEFAKIFVIIFISYINVSNKICDNIRVKYIHQQLNEDSNSIEIIKIPYSDYSTDVIYTFPTDIEVEEIVTDDNMIGSKDRYFDYYKDYIGVDDRFDPKDFVYIPIQDYFMNH